jgi:DNA-binding PadR family transcriptional regulator
VKDERVLPTTAYAVLGLLSFGEELSGYDLKKWADHSLRFFFWSPAISNIYGELKRLERLGFVVAQEVAQDELRNKRVYRITEAGRAELARWIDEAPVEPPMLKDHVLLRVWLGHVAGADRVLALLDQEEESSRRVIDDLRHNVETSRDRPEMTYANLVEQWCLRYATARREAFAELRKLLQDLPATPEPGRSP